jgi:hypothetical protein
MAVLAAQSGEHVEITPAGRPAGGEIYYITVDARGSIDPEAVERAGYRAAQRAIEEAKHDSRVTIRTGMG